MDRKYRSISDHVQGCILSLIHIYKKKFKTDLFSFNIQTNGGLQPLQVSDDINDIPRKFLVQADPEPNNAAIREYLKDHEVEWAKLLPRGESLRIR